MRIEHVSCKGYRIPPSVPWEDATNKVQWLEFIVVEIRTNSGLVGTGISYTVDVGGTAIVSLIEDYLSHIIIGMNPLHYEEIWYKLQRQSRRIGLGVNSMAIAAIDIAIWDIMGKHYGQPLYKLLGGAREQIPAYISEINLKEDDTLEQLANRIEQYMEWGYRTVKIKIGKEDVEEDIERIRKVQDTLGPGGTVLVDLNQKLSSAEALAFCSKLDGLNLGWIEEPMLYHDVHSHRQLKQSISTPIALGESLYSKYQVLDYLKNDAVDFVQADVAFVGGITEWLKIAHLANAFGKPVAPHYMMELSLHLLCGVQNGYMLENVVGGSFTELDVLEHPITVENAVGIPPQRPGHGIVFDAEKLAKYEIDQSSPSEFLGGSK